MSTEYLQALDPRRQQAIRELIELVTQYYPTTSFVIGPSAEDPGVTHITATVDTDDPDEVTDLTIERELALNIDEGIPVYVIPIRTPERTAALRAAQIQRRKPVMTPSPLAPTS